MKNFWTRFLSGLLYALLITISIFYSNISFKILITILSTIVLKEYFNLVNLENYSFLLLTLFFIWAPKNLIINNYIIITICVVSLISNIYCTILLFFNRGFKYSKINFYLSSLYITTSFFFTQPNYVVQSEEHF